MATSVAVAVAVPTPPPAWPPANYRLSEVSLRVTHDPAQGQPPQRMALSGEGQGTLYRRGQLINFRIERKGVLDWINALYRMRFFDLPSMLGSERSVIATDNGSVVTQTLKLHDVPTTTVCFALPRYEKCVMYQDQPPRELEAWVACLLAEGESSGASMKTMPP